MDYFTIEQDKASGYTGYVDGTYKWGLPGVICPLCKSPWSGGFAYPSVDLTPVACVTQRQFLLTWGPQRTKDKVQGFLADPEGAGGAFKVLHQRRRVGAPGSL